MLKMLAKKGKSNKGFTLIELIVVIAIIAILALLLVPRFAGFTDDARVSNDRNACRTIERAFMTLLANDTIRRPASNSVIAIGRTGTFGTPSVDIPYIDAATGSYTAATAGELQAEVVALTGTLAVQSPSHTVGFSVTIANTGEVTCTVD